MKRNILLLEPNYKNKFPPIGLMKLATYFRLRGDNVVFYKGDLKEFLINDITSFDMAGNILFTICGSNILKKVCVLLNPNVKAASFWPFGILKIPLLNISAKYAA